MPFLHVSVDQKHLDDLAEYAHSRRSSRASVVRRWLTTLESPRNPVKHLSIEELGEVLTKAWSMLADVPMVEALGLIQAAAKETAAKEEAAATRAEASVNTH